MTSTISYVLTDRRIPDAFLTHPSMLNLTHARFVAAGLRADDPFELQEKGHPLNVRVTGIIANEAIYQWLRTQNIGASLDLKFDDGLRSINGFTLSEIFHSSTVSIEVRNS